MRPADRAAVLLLLAASSLTISGCALPMRSAGRDGLTGVTTRLSKEELGDLLRQFEDTFEATIRAAAERIAALQTDRRTRRLTLLWQMRLMPMARDTLNQDDAVHSLLDCWVLCIRLRDFFEDGDGRDLFGDQQEIAQAAARRLLQDIERIAARIFTPERLARARPALEDLARQFPLRGEFSGSTVRTAVQKVERDPDVIASILSVPMAPFRAFEGIDRGAAAIQGFTAVAARMTDTVNDLPEAVRLQTELLLMEVEELEAVQATVASLSELARSSARISAVAERLPEDLRREIALAAEDLEARQTRFQETLQEAQAVVARTDEALGRVEAAAAAVDRTAVQAAAAGEAWEGTVRAVTELVASFQAPDGQGAAESPAADPAGPPARRPPAPQSFEPDETASAARPGFDVSEYTRAAEALDRAALQIQELTREIRQLAGSRELQTSLNEIEARAQRLVDQSHASAFAVIDHLAWRGVQLVLLFFAGLLAYAGLTSLRRARRAPQAAGRP